MQAGFTNTFIEMFRKHKLKEGVFNIEITEGAALYSFDEAVAKLSILRNNGIGIHIDDFGVAYSSMLHLKLLCLSTIAVITLALNHLGAFVVIDPTPDHILYEVLYCVV
jgi:predicted signal transduction protein with EAL and GGDEF domain